MKNGRPSPSPATAALNWCRLDNFVAGAAALDADDYFIFNGSDQLLYDADGNGAGAAVLVAEFDTDITAADIFIIA